MEAKEVILAQSIAYAELMQDRDQLRNECVKLQAENAALREQLAETQGDKGESPEKD